MRQKLVIFLCLLFTFAAGAAAQQKRPPSTAVYKTVGSGPLEITARYPPDFNSDSTYPCIVFFFGGGWINGSIKQFMPEADYFVTRGLVCFLVDYRVQSRQGSTPFESLMDAKSAIRYIRENAAKFHIKRDSLIASGGSAGGQLAAACALIDGYSDPSDDPAVSTRPNALVLFNPVIDNGPGGYGFDRVGAAYKDFSPLHNIRRGAPPTIIFLGTKDHLIPVATMQYYQTVMRKVGSRCDLELYKDVGHGFFNKAGFMQATLRQADQFLTSLGYIER